MFTSEDCNYKEYRRILNDIKKTKKLCDYLDVIHEKGQKFLILRHDIEFSIDRAYRLAEIEEEEGVQSSYFVQITNNAYNPFSDKNAKMLREMQNMGHHIGLHYHRNNVLAETELEHDIKLQADILKQLVGVNVDRFSFHRPLKEHLAANIEIDGLVNAYGKEFFVMTDNPTEKLEIKYIADSNHQWKYGEANYDYFMQHDKIQLLVHPLSWSEHGAEHLENFQQIVQEKHDEFVDTIENEWKIFELLRGKL